MEANPDCLGENAARHSARLIVQAYLSASGMVLVPKVATDEMVDARFNVMGRGGFAEYQAMLDAAPGPFKSKP